MSVYAKENPAFLQASIRSMLEQTLPFDEFVIVEDGPLPKNLKAVLNKYAKNPKFKIVSLKENRGLGAALNIGLKECKNELVMRMDSDDISTTDRAEKQIAFMSQNPDIDVCGGYIYEFKESPDEPNLRLKKMPSGNEIPSYMVKRNPLNHMTVCFRKSKIEAVDGYQPLPLMEDYWLWVRLYTNGGKIDNLNQVLTYARISNGFEKRRGNKIQTKSWRKIQNYMLENGLINRRRKAVNTLKMWTMTHIPNSLRKLAYGIIRK